MTFRSLRSDGRAYDEMRPVLITPGVNPYAEGSAEVRYGKTTVLTTASVLRESPKWMQGEERGWITAEYGMLPRSTHKRSEREAAAGKQSGRTLEIQRLIGRALRAAVDLRAIPGITIKLDCDVVIADGGTRTAAVTGGWVALAQAFQWIRRQQLAASSEASLRRIAAVSAGVLNGQKLVDLNYAEDSAADFDLNLVYNESGGLIEVQGTAEKEAVTAADLQALAALGFQAARHIMEEQSRALAAVR